MFRLVYLMCYCNAGIIACLKQPQRRGRFGKK